MSNPLADLAALKPLAGFLPPKVVSVLQIVIPIALLIGVAVGAFALAKWQERKKSGGPPPPVDHVGGPPTSQITADQLRNAWLRFTANLPSVYRRSILNFEHFVVFGAAAAGKSRFIDTYTDWKRQAKQFLGSQSYDADLQVYLASGAIVTEVPARILADHSDRCQAALKNLWKPLYSERAPTVVVVADAMRLRASTAEAVADLGETIRAKINLLSSIRRQRLEVRVVVTHLDEVDGYVEFAKFCREQGISTRILLSPESLNKDIRAQIDEWLESVRSHLPRALTKLSARDFRKVVSFLRAAPNALPAVAELLTALFARETNARDLVPGGVYLISEQPGVANPLRGAADGGPGPDPRRRHRLIAVVAVSACLAFLLAAYRDQREAWAPAHTALLAYQPLSAGSDNERSARQQITSFTNTAHTGILSHPDFFATQRVRMRESFSSKIRDDLLQVRLKQAAQDGQTREGQLRLPQRRALYYLAIIHSSKSDQMKIRRQPNLLQIWSNMTGLDGDLIEDYIDATDLPFQWPVPFDFGAHDVDPLDTPDPWVQFLRELSAEISDGVIKPNDLHAFQDRAGQLLDALPRFTNDEITVTILDQLDAEANAGARADRTEVQLHAAYEARFSDFLRSVKSADLQSQRTEMSRLFRVVRSGVINVEDPTLLRGLVDRLGLLYGVGTGGSDEDKPIVIRLAGQEYTFDPRRWREMIRDSTATEQVSQFVRAKASDGSIFFSRQDADEIRPVVWNPTNDGTAIFVGRGSLDGRYTKDAYERYVRDVLARLGEVLDKSKVPEKNAKLLTDFVREQVKRYSVEYKSQLQRFVSSFSLRAPSQEALRVALTQMSSDNSAFDEYLLAVDKNSTLDIGNGGMLEPMRDVTNEFAHWHAIVDAGSGATELRKYKAILATLLTDLGTPSTDPAAPVDPAAQATETLEKALTPAGRVVLGNLRGEKGSYSKLVNEWLSSVHLSGYQEPPFSAPIEQLNTFGRHDIEHVIARTWQRDMLPDVLKVVQHFPFDPDGKEDATPKELTAVFNPQSGRLFDLFRRYIEPISDVGAGGGFRERAALRSSVSVASDLYPVMNAAAALSAKLWDPAGKPLPIVLRVQTLPFPHGPNPSLALTLIYLNAGDAAVFNFNQQPSTTFLNVDWTKETTSQVGVQLTDLDSKENTFPEPVVAPSSFWSFLHLLKRGSTQPVRQPAGAEVYQWDVKVAKEGTDTIPARFVLLDDAWDKLNLQKFLSVRVAKVAGANDG